MANRSFRTWFEQQEIQEGGGAGRILVKPLVSLPGAAADAIYHGGKAVGNLGSSAIDAIRQAAGGNLGQAFGSAAKGLGSAAGNLLQAGPGALFRYANNAASVGSLGDYADDIKNGRIDYRFMRKK